MPEQDARSAAQTWERIVDHFPLWLCKAIVEVKAWPFQAVCLVVGHKRVGNDCYRCGAGWPW